MRPERELRFPPFRLDLDGERLWQGSRERRLRPRTFAVLRYLAERPGHLVARDALMPALWPGVAVEDGALTACLKEIRRVLGDDPRRPRFIETVHRKGYRWIAAGAAELAAPAPLVVGRATDLERLAACFGQARRGTRKIVFVTGEPGIGKTTLVDAFVTRLATEGSAWIARGECVESYGAAEAYLPVLAALGRLCRGPDAARVKRWLGTHAPTWLVQMPAVLEESELAALRARIAGATRERMLRELAEAIETMTTEAPLVLVLEDLHWSDAATVELLSYLARRREPARLLAVGTYRPTEVAAAGHPLRTVVQDLALHRQCEELALGALPYAAVKDYVTSRLGTSGWPEPAIDALADALNRRTDGNALFLVAIADTLLGLAVAAEDRPAQAVIDAVSADIPENLRKLIEQQFERLTAGEQHVLDAASVAGVEFSAAALETSLGGGGLDADARCSRLARRQQFLEGTGTEEWPDGTVAGRFRFRHAVYQEAVYARLPVGRRTELHRRIGLREEAGWAGRAVEHAARLAVHFERSRDDERAVGYRVQAAKIAGHRFAFREAIEHLTRGLDGLTRLPETPERRQRELDMQIALGVPLVATRGLGSPEVERTYVRARELCSQVRDTPQLFFALRGLWGFYLGRAELATTRELGEELVRLARQIDDPALLTEAHRALGTTLFYLGEITAARAQCEQGIALADAAPHPSLAAGSGQDPGLLCRVLLAHALERLGYRDQALLQSNAAVDRARELGHPFNLANVVEAAARIHAARWETRLTQEHEEALIALAQERGFAQRLATARIVRGWALAQQQREDEGVREMSEGLAAFRATGAVVGSPYYLFLLAEAQGKAGRPAEGLAALDEAKALLARTDERVDEAELYRVQGELLLAPSVSDPAAAAASFQKAIDVARRQGAKTWELRATTRLARLWQREGRRAAARDLLAGVHGWFTEGFETIDLQEARTLLGELSSAAR